MSMSKSKPRTLSIGVISEGTLSTVDIFNALEWDLHYIKLSRKDRNKVQRLTKEFDSLPEGCLTGDDKEILEELFNVAENYVPDYTYLGSLPGDGACIGVWPNEDLLNDPEYDGFVCRSREQAGPQHTHALEGNDHGNATLYRRQGNRWVEVWSVV